MFENGKEIGQNFIGQNRWFTYSEAMLVQCMNLNIDS